MTQQITEYFNNWPAKLIEQYTTMSQQRWRDIKCGRVKITDDEIKQLEKIEYALDNL